MHDMQKPELRMPFQSTECQAQGISSSTPSATDTCGIMTQVTWPEYVWEWLSLIGSNLAKLRWSEPAPPAPLPYPSDANPSHPANVIAEVCNLFMCFGICLVHVLQAAQMKSHGLWHMKLLL